MTRTALLLLCFLLPLQRATARLQTVDDPGTTRSDREVHDVSRVVFDVREETVGVSIHFRRTFPEMMFESATLLVDCDDDAGTGKDGADLRVRALAGSRFHPNSWKPDRPGVPAPLEQLRTAYSTVKTREQGVTKTTSTVWTWVGMLDPPRAARNVLAFQFPAKLIRDAGQRYNRHVPTKLVVLGGCSEHPIPLSHHAADEGVDISVDGEDRDWSAGTHADDPGGELHPDALSSDVRRVRVEHSRGWLYAGVWLDRPGFGDRADLGDDVKDQDRIVVAVEPLGGEYLDYREYVIHTASAYRRGPTYRTAAGKGFVECAIARPDEQTSFRLAVWSDALREDKIPDEGWFRLDTAPWRKR